MLRKEKIVIRDFKELLVSIPKLTEFFLNHLPANLSLLRDVLRLLYHLTVEEEVDARLSTEKQTRAMEKREVQVEP